MLKTYMKLIGWRLNRDRRTYWSIYGGAGIFEEVVKDRRPLGRFLLVTFPTPVYGWLVWRDSRGGA